VLEFIKPKIEEYAKEHPDLDIEIHITTAPYEGITYVKERAKSCELMRFYACGGDGTLFEVVNGAYEYPNTEVAVIPLGSGNDFNRDVHGKLDNTLINLNNYMNNLPLVTVKGQTKKFLNNVSFGIDGWCCEVADKIRAKESSKPINYTAIAVKGALFQYKKTNATVIVDGKEYHYKDVFLASTTKGRFYGGGMMATPDQDRNDPEHKVSVLVFRGKIRLQVLLVFSKIFTGEHIKKPKMCIIHTGKNIQVKFDSPRAVQVDGETVLGVTEYTVKA
jgi:diacylglycerol kinase family enzyme